MLRTSRRLLAALLLAWLALPTPAASQEGEPSADDSLKAALALNRQGMSRRARGDYTGAEAAYREALGLWRKLYPPDRYPAGAPNLATGLNNLGSLLQARGDSAAAEPLMRESLAIWRKLYPPDRYPDGHENLAVSLSNVGDLLRSRGDYAAAETHTREALAMQRKLYPPARFPAGHADIAISLCNLGVIRKSRGDCAEAEALTREALALRLKLYPPTRHPDGQFELSLALNNLADVLMIKGDAAGAAECLRESLAMRRKLYPPARYPDGHPDLALGLSNTGAVLSKLGDHARGEPLQREALAMCRKLYPPERYSNGHPLLATCLSALEHVLALRGEAEEAEALCREALAMRRRLYPPAQFPAGHPDLARSLRNVSAVLWQRQKYAESLMYLKQAELAFRQLYPPAQYPAGHPDLANCLRDLSLLCLISEFHAEAERYAREALDTGRRLYPPERYPDGHPDLVSGHLRLGTLWWVRGKLGLAERHLRQALAMTRKLYPAARYPDGHRDLSTALAELGLLLRERGDRGAARECLREAMTLEQRLLNNFVTQAAEGETLLLLAHLQRYRDEYLSLSGGPGASAADDYAAVWGSRGAVARTLQDRRERLLLAREGAVRDLAREWATTRQALARLLFAPTDASPGQAALVSTLQKRKEELEKELASRLPAFRSGRDRARRGPADLIRRLPAGSAFIDLVSYMRLDQDPTAPGEKGRWYTRCYVAFVLAPGQPIRRVDLGPTKEIDGAVDAWRQELSAGRAGDAAAATLRRKVWQPLEEALPAGARAVLLAPDGALTRLPWAALPGRRAGSVLLEEYALAVAPYGQFLLDCPLAGPAPRLEEGPVLAVGGVAFGNPPRTALVADAGREPGRAALDEGAKQLWPALPGTERELRRLRELAGTRPVRELRGADASTARLLEELPKARWAHLATHGFFADKKIRSVLRLSEQDYRRGASGERIGVGARNPLVLSGLVLAGANLPGKDPSRDDRGILTAEAIAGLNLDRLELAVLSACETGLGEVAGGEGVFGLQRAFHVAGARSVVASLWRVDDEATHELMALFYDNLWRKGLPKMEALRQAQLAMLRGWAAAGAGRSRRPDLGKAESAASGTARVGPHLWAAWVLSGDPGDLTSVRPAAPEESETTGAAASGGWCSKCILGGGAAVGGLVLGLIWLVRRRG